MDYSLQMDKVLVAAGSFHESVFYILLCQHRGFENNHNNYQMIGSNQKRVQIQVWKIMCINATKHLKTVYLLDAVFAISMRFSANDVTTR